MPTTTRRIGLSLGADICWPRCFEDLVAQLDLELPDPTVTTDAGGGRRARDGAASGARIRFQVDRVPIEPFDLGDPTPYDLVVDRLTHWYHTSREWIKKAILTDDLYVYNNPWSLQSMEKHTTYCAMMRLGLPVPETWMVPPKAYEPSPDLEPTLRRYAKLFDLGAVDGQDLAHLVVRHAVMRAGNHDLVSDAPVHLRA